jgi:hypothetical protein
MNGGSSETTTCIPKLDTKTSTIFMSHHYLEETQLLSKCLEMA